jgi:hypothetical protein
MIAIFPIVWGCKVGILGFNTYAVCFGDKYHPLVCGMSSLYFFILVLATFCKFKKITPRSLENMEDNYIRELEEGLYNDTKNK